MCIHLCGCGVEGKLQSIFFRDYILLNNKYIKEIAIENGCTDMYLTANEENEEAIRLYKKIGMKVKNISYSMQL